MAEKSEREVRKVPGRHTVAVAEPDTPEPIDDFPDTRCSHPIANRRAIEDRNYSEALPPGPNNWAPDNLVPGNWAPGNPGCIGRNMQASTAEPGRGPEGHSSPFEPER